MRIVEPQAKSVLGAGPGQFLHRITPKRSCVHNIELTHLRLVHGKPVVVLGRNHDILHARILGQSGDLIGIEHGGIKFSRQGHIFVNRDIGHTPVHNPLTDAVIGFAFVQIPEV